MAKTFRDTEASAAKLATSTLTEKDDNRESLYIKVEGHLFDKVESRWRCILGVTPYRLAATRAQLSSAASPASPPALCSGCAEPDTGPRGRQPRRL